MKNKLSNQQMNYLDLVRIISAFFVLIGHSLNYYHYLYNGIYYPYIQNVAVVIFFLLSGFLTADSISNKVSLKDYNSFKFIKHKFFRIEKELIPGLLFIFLIDYLSIRCNGEKYLFYNAFNIKQFFSNLLLLNDTTINRLKVVNFIPFGSARPMWTLSIDFWFCITFSIVFIPIHCNKKISIKDLIMLILPLFLCSKYLISGRGNGLGFVFSLGALSFFIYRYFDKKTSCIVFTVSIILYIILSIITKEAYSIYSFILLFAIFCSGINIFNNSMNKNRNNILKLISQSTFFLYLIHYSIIDFIFNLKLDISDVFKFFLGILLSFIISFLLFLVFGKR